LKKIILASALAGGLAAAALLLTSATAQTPAATPHAIYLERCASCHDDAGDRTPPKTALAVMAPEQIITTLTNGPMRPMAQGLSEAQITAMAVYLTGKQPLPKVAEGPEPFQCAKADPIVMTGTNWNGWGVDPAQTRYQPNPGLTAADIPRLKVKWTFAYPGSKNGQATVIGERLFIASNAGRVYSLNARTGCVYWRYNAPGGVRTAASVGRDPKAPSGYAVYFGDDRNSVHALDAGSGKSLWATKVEDHPRAGLTGAPMLYGNLLYVPTSSMEETVTNEAAYACCTFRGSIVAVDVRTGKVAWKTHAIQREPRHHQTVGGKKLMGPAGGAIWASPTIDAKRGVLYAATGDSYTDLSDEGTDAIVAMDLKTGKIRWIQQVTKDDNYIVGCPSGGRGAANCPLAVGPDHDFGASVILRTLPNGKDIILAGQKSGVAYGMDPDAKGKILWQLKVGAGGALGGIQFGMAADQKVLYAAVSDQLSGARGQPGITAIDMATGNQLWHQNAPAPKCSWTAGRCSNGQSQAVSAIPGVVFSGALDGHLRAYSTADGKVIWDFDTAGQPYDTVNAVKAAKGGALDAGGPTIAGGMLFQHSGYSGYGGGPNGQNLLMAFSVDGK
jgi:polyvinyl alcohol dehydrogenase (cytochrome)